MGLIQRLGARIAAGFGGGGVKRPTNLSFQDWVDLFTFNGNTYPLLHTTMGTLNEEQPPETVSGVVTQNGPLFSLMLARLQIFSQARFQWTHFARGEPGDLFGSPELAVLERPWLGGTTADLLARMEMDVTGAGNSYIRRLRRRGGDRLVRLRPNWMITVMGSDEDVDHPAEAADVELLGWAYTPGGSRGGDRMVLLGPDEVAHYAPIPDPDSVFVGMSWVTPVLRDVFGDNAAVIHKDRFFRNAATPNLVVKFDKSVTIGQVREFKELLEEEHKGAWNAYKTLYLGGGADPVPIGKDFKEIDFAVTQGKGESRLAAASGVPPSWVGFSEGLAGSALNAGNFTAARRRLSDGTMAHLWGNAAASLQPILTPPDPGASLWFATRGIPFLRPDMLDQAKAQADEAATIVKLVTDGFTPASAVAAVMNQDWSLLEHTGLTSVQLQPPLAAGSAPGGNGSQEAARTALTGGR
jgi:phage portal protein BeeE